MNYEKAVGHCPKDVVSLNNVDCKCLLDSGSEISSITREYFLSMLEGNTKLNECGWIRIKAANHLEVPFIGCVEVDITIMGKVLKDMVVFVVRDPTDESAIARKRDTPGVIGCNILNPLVDMLRREHGKNFASEISQYGADWEKVLHVMSHKVVFDTQEVLQEDNSVPIGYVKLAGDSSEIIPAGSGKVLYGTTCHRLENQEVLVEAADFGAISPDLMICPSTCKVKNGMVPVQVRNYSSSDVIISKHQRIAQISYFEEIYTNSEVKVIVQDNEIVIAEELSSNVDEIVEQLDVNLSHLSDTQVQKFYAMLAKNVSVFSRDDDDLGFTSAVEHKIVTTDDIPIKLPDRFIHPKIRPTVKDQLNKWLKGSIIRESNSPYGSQIVVVKKKDNTIRICIDYRLLNLKTVKDAFPLPNIEQALAALHGAVLFSSLDLTQGYLQMAIHPDDVHKTAFRALGVLYEFLRLPFGLCNSPASFERLMVKCVGDLNYESLLIYLDDILVYATDVDQMINRLDVVFTRL